MQLLFIGGTGLISSACSEFAAARGRGLRLKTIDREMNAKWDRIISAFERARP